MGRGMRSRVAPMLARCLKRYAGFAQEPRKHGTRRPVRLEGVEELLAPRSSLVEGKLFDDRGLGGLEECQQLDQDYGVIAVVLFGFVALVLGRLDQRIGNQSLQPFLAGVSRR